MDDTPPLTAEYRIFHKKDDGMVALRDAKLHKTEGTAKIPAIGRGEKYEFQTDSVKLWSAVLSSNYYHPGGKRNTTSDELEGIWIKLFDGETLVEELIFPSKLKRDAEF